MVDRRPRPAHRRAADRLTEETGRPPIGRVVPRLSEIDPGELSLVRRGANRRPWTVKKSDELLLPQLQDVLALPVDGDDRFVAELRKTDVAEDAGLAALGAYRLLKAHADELPEPLAELLKQMDALDCEDGGEAEPDDDEVVAKAYEAAIEKKDYSAEQRQQMASDGRAMPNGSYPIDDSSDLENAVHAIGRGKNEPHAQIRAHIVARAKALKATDLLPDSWNVSKEDDMPEGDGALVPFKKDDGGWDVSMLPEESRDAMAAFLKSQDDEREAELKKAADERSEIEKQAAEANEIAKSEREIRETREYFAKAEELGQPGDDFGPVLKAIAAAVDADTFEKLESVLKTAHRRAVDAGIFKEIGANGDGDGESALEQLEKKADEIKAADSSLTKEQAFAKALDENPDLYARYREEA
jgi:hypothetical protein